MGKKKILVIIDAQNDFISGSLKNKEAEAAIPNIVKLIEKFDGDFIFLTKDTHYPDYLNSKEGRKLPVKHCIDGTDGWNINKDVMRAVTEWYGGKDGRYYNTVEKHTFGSSFLADEIDKMRREEEDVVADIDIEICGFCSDICVISNALLMKERMYDSAEIYVHENCCAGVTPQSHEAAMAVMESCQINIIRE